MPFKLSMPFDYAGASRVDAYRSSAQTLTRLAYTTVIFNAEEYDNLGEYNTTTGEFSPNNSGYYYVSARIASANVAWISSQVWASYLFIDATRVQVGNRTLCWVTRNAILDSIVHGVIYLTSEQALTVQVYHDNAANVATFADRDYCNMQIHRAS